MSTGLVVAEVSETYETCLQRMQQARVRHLIVLERGRLAGILSLRDLAVDLDEKDEAIALLNAYVHYIPADMARKPEPPSPVGLRRPGPPAPFELLRRGPSSPSGIIRWQQGAGAGSSG